MSDEVSIPEKRTVPFKQSHKRSKCEIERDKADISRLYLDQKTQLQIVDWIKHNRPYSLSLTTVHVTIQALFAEWRKQAVHHIDELRARDLARLLDIEKTATEAWQRSLLTSEKTTHEHDGNDGKPRLKKNGKPYKTKPHLRVSVVKENRDGDPRFLDIILKCIAQRSEILGYRPNRKIDEGGENTPLRISVEVATALEIAYGDKNGGNTEAGGQSRTAALVSVRASGGGPWRPEGSIPELRQSATDIESEAT